MQGRSYFPHRTILLALLATLLLSVGLFQIKPIEAQTVPTATPSDPLWIAFSKVRDALESKFHTDLTIVSNWNYSETEFKGGIDDCVKAIDPSQVHQLFYGWRFVITGLDNRQFEGRSS